MKDKVKKLNLKVRIFLIQIFDGFKIKIWKSYIRIKLNLSGLYVKLKSLKILQTINLTLNKLILIFLSLSLLVLTFLTFTLLAGLRHRQLCSYQSLVEQGKVIKINDSSLCKNVFDLKNIPDIAFDVISPKIDKKVAINKDYNPRQTAIDPEDCTNSLSAACFIKTLDGDVAQTEGYTNVLLVAVDARDGNAFHGNTDSIMLVSYHHATGEILLTSFPRDLLLGYTNPYGSYVFIKINAIYSWYPEFNKDALNAAVSQVTGRPIHYYAYFSFDSFRYVIDRLGGIDVTLDKNFADAFPSNETLIDGRECNYLRNLYGFCYFEFPSGVNHFDSFQAMVYARARYLSNDYERALRQQKVVNSTINAILNNKMTVIERFDFYKDIYNNVKPRIITNIELKDLSGVFKILNKVSKNPSSIVLEPKLDNNTIIYDAGVDPEYGYVVKFYDYSYESLRAYINDIWKFLPYFKDRPKILVINTTGKPIAGDSNLNDFLTNKIKYAEVKVVEDPSKSYKGTRVYDISKVKGSALKAISKDLKGSLLYSAELEDIEQSSFGEDILIIYGN